MRRSPVALALLLGALAAPAPAHADGDPASDVLLSQDVFTPYAPRVSKPVARALDQAVAAVKRAGWPIQVALIQEPADLGAYPQLFGKAQRYADLLAVELSFNRHPRLLTVMPNGFGGKELGPQGRAVLARVPVDRAARSDGLALAAARALPRLATAAGHPVPDARLPAPATVASKPSSSGTTAVLFLAPVGLLALAGGAAVLLARRRDAQADAARS